MQKGEASVYARSLSGRRMADGTPFDPASDAAASRTLPLGTAARVTNLENGRTTTVRVHDRGPRVRSRVLDVSPGSAARLGTAEGGVAPVTIAPTRLPQRAGRPAPALRWGP